jgi:hypothetical protein
MTYSELWFRRRSLGRMLAVLALVTPVASAACDSTSGSGSGSAGGLAVSVISPAEGAQVTAPFTVKVQASVPLGPTGSGKHHVHVYFDDHEDDYTIVESDTGEIVSAPAGEHTLHVSLRNANHSPAGAEASIKVVVGGTPGGGTTTSAPDPGPYGY